MPDLAATLHQVLSPAATPAARAAAERLRDTYRSGAPPTTLAIGDEVSAAAYAAYRMPATAAAIGQALGDRLALAPATHLDLGGGTGAATWAVQARWPDTTSTVLDASPATLALGRRLARHAGLRVTWEQRLLGRGLTLPAADLTTVGYLLGELEPDTARAVVCAALLSSRALLVVEPGTPRGYAAVLAARDAIRSAGWTLLAPCPHADDCPLVAPDWCHFVVRVQRSALHRELKSGALGHEDEKFSYVLAVREAADGAPAAGSRVLRHPVRRKGLVQFRLCEPQGSVAERIVSRREGDRYREARDTDWGDLLPPPAP